MAVPFPPIPDDVLRRTAGPGAFARGAAYHKEGRVDLLSVGSGRAVAAVRGSETYRVELGHVGNSVRGVCECRAFEDSAFCKHMVALALTASDAGAIDRLAALRGHLLAQEKEALVERVLRVAERDDQLRREIAREMADAVEDDDALVARYRLQIDQATDPRGGVDYWGAGAYADKIVTVVGPLERLAHAGRAAIALPLVNYLLEQIQSGIEETDDSEGEVFAVGQRACDLHLALCRMVQPDPQELAAELFEREMASTSDLFSDADTIYADVLGPAGLAEFRQLARQAWSALPPPKRGLFDARRHTLKAILDRAAQQGGDIEARIALRKTELTAPAAYAEIADICIEAGRPDEALRWLEEGLWCFEDRPDERLTRKAAGLMAELGRTPEAAALLWGVFERNPSVAAYRELAALPHAGPAAPRAFALLRDLSAKAARPGAWINGPASTLFDLQMESAAIDDAWETAQTWGVGENRLRILADRSLGSHAALAAATYGYLAESRIHDGGATNYDIAIDLIRRRGEACGDAVDQAAFIAALRVRHKAKRTFIQRLQALG